MQSITIVTHEVTATSFGGSNSGTVDFTLEVSADSDFRDVVVMAGERAKEELRDSGYRVAPFDLEIDGVPVKDHAEQLVPLMLSVDERAVLEDWIASQRVDWDAFAPPVAMTESRKAAKAVASFEVLKAAFARQAPVSEVPGRFVLVDDPRPGQKLWCASHGRMENAAELFADTHRPGTYACDPPLELRRRI